MSTEKPEGGSLFVGVDPGTHVTGVSIVDHGVLVETFSIRGVGPSTCLRAIEIAGKFEEEVFLLRTKPDYVIIEEPFSRGMKTVKALAYVNALVSNVCHHHGVPFGSVAPARWQKLVRKKGATESMKQQTQSWCKEKFDVNLPYDEADAAAIGYWAWWNDGGEGH